MTAVNPAMDGEKDELIPRFRDLLAHPFDSTKVMLSSLDRLAGSTHRKRDKHCFYVVMIKETISSV